MTLQRDVLLGSEQCSGGVRSGAGVHCHAN